MSISKPNKIEKPVWLYPDIKDKMNKQHSKLIVSPYFCSQLTSITLMPLLRRQGKRHNSQQ